MKINFLILAGGGASEWILNKERVKHKCLIKINDKPSISYIIESIKNFKKDFEIVLIGTSAIKDAGIDKTVDKFIEVGIDNSLADNVRLGMKESGEDFVVITSGDIPGVSTQTISEIVKMVNEYSSYEFIVPIITKDEIESKFPGSKRTYGKIKEGKVKVGNFLVIRKSSFDKLNPIIDKYTEGRKSLIKLMLSFGIWNLIKLVLMGSLTIPELEKILYKTTGLNAKAVIVPLGEVGVDLDKESDLEDLKKYLSKEIV
jgi:CTP:molybdopterin cytidylyltransferase MocA